MRFFNVALNVLGLGLLAFSKASSPPLVDLGYATYQGLFNTSANITNFLGIRYAAPPVGEQFGVLLITKSMVDSFVVFLSRKFAIPGSRTAS